MEILNLLLYNYETRSTTSLYFGIYLLVKFQLEVLSTVRLKLSNNIWKAQEVHIE